MSEAMKEKAKRTYSVKVLHHALAECSPKLSRGQVWCTECGSTQKVNAAHCLATGWPKCCGYTMTIDSPDERKALETTA